MNEEVLEDIDEKTSEAAFEDKHIKKKLKKDKKAMKFLKPNFFIGFQIYEAEIHQKVKKLQEIIISKNPRLHSALVDISTLHVTLAVTHLANEKDIENIKEKLDEWAKNNVKVFFQKPFTLSFTGIKDFRNIVAYLDVDSCASKEKLSCLSKDMNAILSSAGFTTNKKAFTPHVTILKLSKDLKLLKAKKDFRDDFDSLKNCNEHFGKQEISTLQLLSMNDPKDEKGYYKCLHQIYVSDPVVEVNHSDCCSPIQIKKTVSDNE